MVADNAPVEFSLSHFLVSHIFFSLQLAQRRFDRISASQEGRTSSADVVSILELIRFIERFSFERRKVIGFAITMPHDWLKRLAPHFHPIRSKIKTNRDSLARVFPRFVSATCNYYEF